MLLPILIQPFQHRFRLFRLYCCYYWSWKFCRINVLG